MTTRTRLLLVAAILAPLAIAQNRSPSVYKVDFVIRDSGDAGAKTGRKYSMVVNEHQRGTFRVGNRVPMATSNSPGSTQFTYIDVGVNLDCTVGDQDGRFAVRADLDLSSAVNTEKNPNANPTISQIKLNVDTTLMPAKPTIIASFDDPVTSRKFDVEATVTKVP
jgi:hypothetical protein